MDNITPIEIRKQIIKDFAHFLKSKNIYVEFRTNIAKVLVRIFRHSALEYSLPMGFFYGLEKKILIGGNLEKLSYSHALSLISNAFNWSSTEQGHFFWGKLHDEWVNYLMKNYKQHELLLS